ncbi:conserved hypothetical protein [Parafrankia sp. EAN1pec]|uniref:hypothetical protein n=1 Tax=Parafrankia sp. (strain EAN1pec) TaxID=298653 RepID=UPI0000542ACA|nr:conserved hypothetical protein [Frankia sp. EAN1pec]
MSGGAGPGGRRATQPNAGWRPADRLPPDTDGVRVRFVEESGWRSKVFEFAGLPVEPDVQRWLARVFARRAGPRSATKRIATAAGHFHVLQIFAALLAETSTPPRGPADLRPAHISAFLLRYGGQRCQREYLKRLRVLLRDDPELPELTRTALLSERVAPPAESSAVVGYSDAEWQQIMTAVRRDLRLARDRIRDGRRLLDRFRAGGVPPVSRGAEFGLLLDVFDRTGDLPRVSSGQHSRAVLRAGGMTAVGGRLCLSSDEAVAFCLLLVALTGENFGTVAAWPAVCHRPDGADSDTGVALVEAVKPRRGPDREHMITVLEDVPAGLAEVLDTPGDDHRLFRSPLRVYRLLVELGEVSCRHGGHHGAVSAFVPRPGKFGSRWVEGANAQDLVGWARRRGFPAAAHAGPDTKPAVHVGRLRQSVIERRCQPVAHSRHTMNDHYLRRSHTVRDDSRVVVGDALREQVDKARATQSIPVFTADFLADARRDLVTAAAKAGVDPDTLRGLIAGAQDTALASCTEHRNGPHVAPGQPCPASFLDCLDCRNARALPHQLGVQIVAVDRMCALRPHLDPAAWTARLGRRLDQLEEILNHYTRAERDRARETVTDRQRQLVGELLDGRWDLR